MAKGLPKWAIREAKARGAKNIFAYAWTLVKRKGKKGSRKSNPKKTVRRGGRKMAKKKRRYRRSMTVPLAPILGFAAGLTMPAEAQAQSPANLLMAGRFTDALNGMLSNYTGYNVYRQKWDITYAKGLLPLIMGMLVHKFVGGSPLNLNRMLARHKIPLLRI